MSRCRGHGHAFGTPSWGVFAQTWMERRPGTIFVSAETSECVITSQRTGLGASSASESRPAQVQTRGLIPTEVCTESLFRLDNEYPARMIRVKNEELVKWKAQPQRSAPDALSAQHFMLRDRHHVTHAPISNRNEPYRSVFLMQQPLEVLLEF